MMAQRGCAYCGGMSPDLVALSFHWTTCQARNEAQNRRSDEDVIRSWNWREPLSKPQKPRKLGH